MNCPEVARQTNSQTEVLIYDSEVRDVYTLVDSVGPEVSTVRAKTGTVASQIFGLLNSGATTIHILGHIKPGQVELAVVLDEPAWEDIATKLKPGVAGQKSSKIFGESRLKCKSIVNWKLTFGLVRQEIGLWAKITRSV